MWPAVVCGGLWSKKWWSAVFTRKVFRQTLSTVTEPIHCTTLHFYLYTLVVKHKKMKNRIKRANEVGLDKNSRKIAYQF